MISGIDFSEYYSNEDISWSQIMEESNCDSLRLVVIVDEFETVLKDGDSYTIKKGDFDDNYIIDSFFLYAPKKVASIIKDDEIIQGDLVSVAEDWLPGVFYINPDIFGTDIEAKIIVNYEDGTEESITVYITKTADDLAATNILNVYSQDNLPDGNFIKKEDGFHSISEYNISLLGFKKLDCFQGKYVSYYINLNSASAKL